MRYMIKAVLSNPRHPEYGQTTVSFPIPAEDYEHALELLKPLGIGDTLERDCRIDGLDSADSVLQRLKDSLTTLDELDYLAKRLESFCVGEDAQFQAMAHKLSLTDIKDFINLTFCCQQATVITDFSDLEGVGREHYMNLHGGCARTEELDALDGYETALLLIGSGAGTVTPYGVVYDNGMKLEPLYNGRQFPAYLYDRSVMMLEITPRRGLSEGQNPEYLSLPAPESQLKRAILRAGIGSYQDAQLQLVFDGLPELTASVLDLEHLSGNHIPILNRLCRAVMPMTEADRENLNAGGPGRAASGGAGPGDERHSMNPIMLRLARSDEGGEVCLRLPAAEGEVDRALNRLAAYAEDVGAITRIFDVISPVSGLKQYIQNADIENSRDLRKLNQLAELIEEMDARQLQLFSGALDCTSVNGLDDVLQIAENLDCYELLDCMEQRTDGPAQEMGQNCPGFC